MIEPKLVRQEYLRLRRSIEDLLNEIDVVERHNQDLREENVALRYEMRRRKDPLVYHGPCASCAAEINSRMKAKEGVSNGNPEDLIESPKGRTEEAKAKRSEGQVPTG